jgi:Zn ribbon nucleic-acid-binding protein
VIGKNGPNETVPVQFVSRALSPKCLLKLIRNFTEETRTFEGGFMGSENSKVSLAGAKCPQCSHQLAIEDLGETEASGEPHCPKCHFPLGPIARSSAIKLDKSQAFATPQVKVIERGSEFKIEIKWLSRASGFVIFFASLWNGIVWLTLYPFVFDPSRAPTESQVYLFLGAFVLIGLWLAYQAICEIFNTTTIRLQANKLSFWTKPFPTQGGHVIEVANIANLALERSQSGKQNGQTVFKHFVNIQLTNGKSVRLCKVQDLNEGLYVEKLLEEKLGLKDNPALDRVAF